VTEATTKSNRRVDSALFSKKWGESTGIPGIGTQRFSRIPSSTLGEKSAPGGRIVK